MTQGANDDQASPSVSREAGILLFVLSLGWAVITAGSVLLGKPHEAGAIAVGFGIVAPTEIASLCLFAAALPRGFVWQYAAVLGGAVVRTALVVAVGFACYWFIEMCHRGSFWIWLGLAYVLGLSTEVILVLVVLKRWAGGRLPTESKVLD